ncbi:MAG: hypothetical protein BWY71_00124 [Planctomycetes bacterium ADurb.Bin412]|nr:MAG: hypothetical protein BWY71_00124 [Planctomycetes bacterium ADurb.Bin412]
MTDAAEAQRNIADGKISMNTVPVVVMETRSNIGSYISRTLILFVLIAILITAWKIEKHLARISWRLNQ